MKTKRTPLSSLRLLDGCRPALIICGDCKQDWCLHRSKYSNNKRKKKKGHCVTSDITTTTFPITTTTLPTHLLIIFKAVYNITSAVRVCVATTKRRKERNASGCWTERREGERERTRSIGSQNRPHWWLHIKESCFLFLTFGVVVCFIFISLLNVLT